MDIEFSSPPAHRAATGARPGHVTTIFAAGALGFGVLALLCLLFGREAGRVAAIWPANGVLLAVLLKRPRGEAPWLLAGALSGNVAVAMALGDGPALATLLSLANIAEVLLAVLLIRRVEQSAGRAFDVNRAGDLWRFACIGVAVPAVSATIAGLALAAVRHEALGEGVARWFLADALGLLVVTPPLLLACSKAAWAETLKLGARRLAMCAVALSAVLVVVFTQTQFPILFLIPPILTLVLFQGGAGAAAASLLIASAVSLAAVVVGIGPIALIKGGLDQRALVQQLFLATMVFATLPVSAALTDRGRTAALMRKQLDVLKLAERTAGIGNWRLNIATGAVTWSDEVYRIHGVSPESFDPNYGDAIDFYHPDDRQAVVDCVSQAVADGEPRDFKLRLIRADGAERIVASHVRPEVDAGGEVRAVFGVFQDITDREHEHAEMVASELRFRLLADRTSDIIATHDLEGRCLYISPAARTVLGREPHSFMGRRAFEFIHPDDHEPVRLAYRAYSDAGPGAPSPAIRYRALLPDGGWIWLEARPVLIRDAQGRPVEIQDSIRDISATKALEVELIEARDAAEAGAQAKSDFLANMSHELRTPLTSVIGFSGLLQAAEGMPEQGRTFADRISTSSQALMTVINDILDYSKLEAEAVDLDPRPFEPRRLAEGAASMLEAQAEAKGLALIVRVDEAVPVAVMGDEGRLRQVMLNFLSNAVKFTAGGSVTLSVSAGEGRMRVEVIDTGIGVAPQKIDSLFERFTQADASTTRTYGGTGLGLAISQRLIGLMDGRIGATSAPGEGSTFWFEIEAAAAELVETVEADIADEEMAGARVLMADDAEANRELVRAMTMDWPIMLDTVEDGAAAFDAARHGGYDLILMDVHMPVMDGLEATRKLRAECGADTPILALTANVRPDQIAACLAAGMDGHIAKPIQATALADAIAQALSRAHRRDTQPDAPAAAGAG